MISKQVFIKHVLLIDIEPCSVSSRVERCDWFCSGGLITNGEASGLEIKLQGN